MAGQGRRRRDVHRDGNGVPRGPRRRKRQRRPQGSEEPARSVDAHAPGRRRPRSLGSRRHARRRGRVDVHTVEAWGRPVENVAACAEIKVPAGIDVGSCSRRVRCCSERAAQGAPRNGGGRGILRDAFRALRDTARPPQARLAAALARRVVGGAASQSAARLRHRERPLPVQVERVER